MNWIITAALLLALAHAGDADAAGPSVGGSAGSESGTQLRRDAEQRRALEARKSRSERESDSQSSARSVSRSRSLTRAASERLEVSERLSASAIFIETITEYERPPARSSFVSKLATACRIYASQPMLYWPYTYIPRHPLARYSSVKQISDCYLVYSAIQSVALSKFAALSSITNADGAVIVTDRAAARELTRTVLNNISAAEVKSVFMRDASLTVGQMVSPVARVCVSPLPDGSPAYFCYFGTAVAGGPARGQASGLPMFTEVITPSAYTHTFRHVIGSCEIDTMIRTMQCAGVDYLGPKGSHGVDVAVQIASDRSIQTALRIDRAASTEARVSREQSKESSKSASMSKARATSRASTDSASSRSDSGVTVSPPN